MRRSRLALVLILVPLEVLVGLPVCLVRAAFEWCGDLPSACREGWRESRWP
jgi:hypothetical protein